MTRILQTEVQLGRQGRLVIPAELRRAMAVADGDPLIARVEEGRLILEKQSNVRDRLKARFAPIAAEISLSDELIADRRREAQRGIETRGLRQDFEAMGLRLEPSLQRMRNAQPHFGLVPALPDCPLGIPRRNHPDIARLQGSLSATLWRCAHRRFCKCAEPNAMR